MKGFLDLAIKVRPRAIGVAHKITSLASGVQLAPSQISYHCLKPAGFSQATGKASVEAVTVVQEPGASEVGLLGFSSTYFEEVLSNTAGYSSYLRIKGSLNEAAAVTGPKAIAAYFFAVEEMILRFKASTVLSRPVTQEIISDLVEAELFSQATGRNVVRYGHPPSVRFYSSAAEPATRQTGGKATPVTAAAFRKTTSRGIFMKGVQAPCAVPKTQSRWNGWPLRFVLSIPISVTIVVEYKIGDEDKERMTVEGQENLQGPEVAQVIAPLEEQKRVKTTHPPTDSAEEDEDEDEDENKEETRTNNATDSCVKKPKLLQALGGILPPKYKADGGKYRV